MEVVSVECSCEEDWVDSSTGWDASIDDIGVGSEGVLMYQLSDWTSALW
jgi:hypothetical protein